MLWILFFLTGFLSLIYEMVWIKQATLLFGTATLSMSTVTAVFFAGMGFGSYWFGKKSLIYKNSIKAYGYIEIVTGVWVLATPLLFSLSRYPISALYTAFGESGPLIPLIRVLFVFIILFPPTFLMGGTLPLLISHSVKDESNILSKTGLLNSVNTAGAFIGVLVAGFIAIPRLGLREALLIGGLFDILIGLYLLYYSKGREHKVASAKQFKITSWDLPLYLIFFSIGFSAMGNEIVWTRFLSLLVYNTVYTYTLTVASILLGLAVGYWAITLLTKKITSYGPLFGALATLTAIVTTVILLLPPSISRSMIGEGEPIRILMTALILFSPPATLSGMLFPLAVKLATRKANSAGAVAGMLTATNIAGGVIGSFTTGFILLPRVGMQLTLFITTAILMASGLVALFRYSNRTSRVNISLISVFALTLWIAYPMITKTVIPHSYMDQESLLLLHEGVASILTVRKGDGGNTVFEIDRLWQGESRKNRQFLAAHIPMILNPNAKDVAVVGLGVGQTARRFLKYPISNLYCIDIEPMMVPIISAFFEHRWIEDPRANFITEDGRFFLGNTEKKFDLISLEVGQTFRPNLASFYTVEFYREAKKRLNENGMVSQFIPIASFNFQEFKRAIRSFTEVFPDAILWSNSSEFLLIGSPSGQPTFSFNNFSRVTALEDLAADLAFSYFGNPSFTLDNPLTFTSGFLMGAEGLQKLTSGVEPYRDNRPDLEFFAALNQVNEYFLDTLSSYYESPLALDPEIPSEVLPIIERSREILLNDIKAQTLFAYAQKLRSLDILLEAHRANPVNIGILLALAHHYQRDGDLRRSLEFFGRAAHFIQDDPEIKLYIALLLHSLERIDEAIDAYHATLQLNPEEFRATNNLGVIYASMNEFDEALKWFNRTLAINPAYEHALHSRREVIRQIAEAGK